MKKTNKKAPKKAVKTIKSKSTKTSKVKTNKPKTAPQKRKSKKNDAKAGEFWYVNDKKTKGHKSLITKRKKNSYDKIEHIPITEANRTNGKNNIKLQENPEKNSDLDTYILSKVQKTKIKTLGSKQNDIKITNPVDKSIVRHLKNERKRNIKKNKKRM